MLPSSSPPRRSAPSPLSFVFFGCFLSCVPLFAHLAPLLLLPFPPFSFVCLLASFLVVGFFPRFFCVFRLLGGWFCFAVPGLWSSPSQPCLLPPFPFGFLVSFCLLSLSPSLPFCPPLPAHCGPFRFVSFFVSFGRAFFSCFLFGLFFVVVCLRLFFLFLRSGFFPVVLSCRRGCCSLPRPLGLCCCCAPFLGWSSFFGGRVFFFFFFPGRGCCFLPFAFSFLLRLVLCVLLLSSLRVSPLCACVARRFSFASFGLFLSGPLLLCVSAEPSLGLVLRFLRCLRWPCLLLCFPFRFFGCFWLVRFLWGLRFAWCRISAGFALVFGCSSGVPLVELACFPRVCGSTFFGQKFLFVPSELSFSKCTFGFCWNRVSMCMWVRMIALQHRNPLF